MDRPNIAKLRLKSMLDVKEGDSLWWMSIDDVIREARVTDRIGDLIKVRLFPTLYECGVRSDRRDGWELTLNLFTSKPGMTDMSVFYTYRDAQGHIEDRSLRLFTTRYECIENRLKELRNRIDGLEDQAGEVADEEFPRTWQVTCPECGYIFQNRDEDWSPAYHNKSVCICPRCYREVYESPENCREIGQC